MSQYVLNFDGACEPTNPGGWMVWSWRLVDSTGNEVAWGSDIRGRAKANTNNLAEWFALGCGLAAIREKQITPSPLIILGDSKLVICQLTGEWECRKPSMIQLRDRCLKHLEGWEWDANWIPREQNEVVDQLGRRKFLEVTGTPMRQRRSA